jgi:hypothetical protein
MAAEIQIHLEGFIDFRGIVSDPEKPKEVTVGYMGKRSMTPTPEQALVVLKWAADVGGLVMADVIARVICKHVSKDKSKTMTVNREIVNVDDEGKISQIIKEQITRK